MRLVPFSAQYLRRDKPLPFGIRDQSGRLLLEGGTLIDSAEQLAELQSQPLFADAQESADWTRRLQAAMAKLVRQGGTMRQAGAAPDASAAAREEALAEQWDRLVMQLDSALRDARVGNDWLQRLQAVQQHAAQLLARRPDASCYYLVYQAGHSAQRYSSHHALLTMLICEQAAPMLGWSQQWQQSLTLAALCMNVAMQRLQDELALSADPPSAAMRAEIDAHPVAGVQLLRDGGLADELCLQVVTLHHDASHADAPLAMLAPERQLARLLRRVDIFGAKISRRANRQPMSPVQAAREACLGVGGVPDEIGSALLKAVGLYPPGSFVELASGEQAIVVGRGQRVNLPLVATLVSPGGTPLGEPALRDTIDPRHAVKSALVPTRVKVRPPHEKLMAGR